MHSNILNFVLISFGVVYFIISNKSVMTSDSQLWNAALCKPTAMSSVFKHGTGDKAVDGNRNGYFNQGSCAHTGNRTSIDHWWIVDLEDEYLVHEVIITNRADGGDNRIHLVSIDLYTSDPRLDTALFPHSTDGVQCVYISESFDGTKAFDCAVPSYARYIKVLRTFQWYFNFCEIEVMVSHKKCNGFVDKKFNIVKDSIVASSSVLVENTITDTATKCVMMCVGQGNACGGCVWTRATGKCQIISLDIHSYTVIEQVGTNSYIEAPVICS